MYILLFVTRVTAFLTLARITFKLGRDTHKVKIGVTVPPLAVLYMDKAIEADPGYAVFQCGYPIL